MNTTYDDNNVTRQQRLAIVPTVILIVLIAKIAGANTFYVTNAVDGAGGSLRVALSSTFDGDTIDATGLSGSNIVLTLGELSVSHGVTILGPGPDALTIIGTTPGVTNRVFHVRNAGTVVIAGLTITRGNVARGSFPADAGGGILNENSTLTVSNCIVTRNSATWAGGIYNNGENGNAKLTLVDTSVESNTADQGYDGGGLYNDGEDGNATLTITNSQVSFNFATFAGGGIYNDGEYGIATLKIIASMIENNRVATLSNKGDGGGGIFNSGYSGVATLIISNSAINGNSAPDRDGGGIYNDATDMGTAVAAINGCTFYNNTAKFGGAIYNVAATVGITNSTLSGNSAKDDTSVYHGAGAIYNYGSGSRTGPPAVVRLMHSTLSKNEGGAIFADASASGAVIMEIGHTILDGQDDTYPVLTNKSCTITSDGYNLCSDDGAGQLNGVNDQILTDPTLGPLQDNGGPTLTHALLPGSTAIDAGDPYFSAPDSYDQRGAYYLRVSHGQVDIGAFELQSGFIINPVWDGTITNDPNYATITNTIITAIHNYESNFTDPITVTIKFAEMNSGLGKSVKYYQTMSYGDFVLALTSDRKTTNDFTAMLHLPYNSSNPVNGDFSINLTDANLRALGLDAFPPAGEADGTISLNVSIMNLDRTTIDPSKYDLMVVAEHEIDEVLSLGSALNGHNNGDPAPTGPIWVADLFRYDQTGARSFNTALSSQAYFSIDGSTHLARFNQTQGADFQDWYSPGGQTPQVQDAFGTPGATPNPGVELIALDASGYDFTGGVTQPPPTPDFQSITHDATSILFSWRTLANRKYQVQYSTDLNQTGWINLGNPITANGPSASFSESLIPGGQRFYRIAIVPSPDAHLGAPKQFLPLSPPLRATNYFLPDRRAR